MKKRELVDLMREARSALDHAITYPLSYLKETADVRGARRVVEALDDAIAEEDSRERRLANLKVRLNKLRPIKFGPSGAGVE